MKTDDTQLDINTPATEASPAKSRTTKAMPKTAKSKNAGQRMPKGKGDKAGSKPREGTKQAQLVAMLRRPKGASIAEASTVLGWLPHTTRAAISHALGKKLGLTIVSAPDEKRGRVYRIAA